MSLITTPMRLLAHCPACDSTRVTAIAMTLTDGSRVDFSSCHRCEHRSWQERGNRLSVQAVLSKAQKHKKQ